MRNLILFGLILIVLPGPIRAEFADEPVDSASPPAAAVTESAAEPATDESEPTGEAEVEAPVPGDGTAETEPAPAVETEPDEVIEPDPPAPRQPRVNPELRKMYLRGSNIGSGTGPRALKKPAGPKRERQWKSELEIGATGYRGNTDSEFFLLKLQTERAWSNTALRLSGRGTLGNKDGERDRENGEIEAALRRGLQNRWYVTAEGRYFTDAIADLDYQFVGVLSPGYEWIRTDTAYAALELGPAYIVERKGGEDNDFAAFRLAAFMEQTLDQRILLWQRLEYLPSIDDTGVYLLITEFGVETLFTDWIRMRTMVQQRYDSDPADDKDKQDIFLSASLVTVF
jgi:putative salt-induced outer membrane protein YdiY